MNQEKSTYQIVSKSNLSLIDGWATVWFTGTEEACKRTLPRIRAIFYKTSDEFKIIKKS